MNKQREQLKSTRTEAVALSYNEEKANAPIVVAKGKGKVAENIIAKATDYEIPIQADPSLVELLSQLDMHETIPEQLFEAVAEVFAFIYKIDKHVSKK